MDIEVPPVFDFTVAQGYGNFTIETAVNSEVLPVGICD